VFWPLLSVQEHLEFLSQLKGLTRKESKQAAYEMAIAVGLGSEEVYARYAKHLSGGMRRRLSIASALLCSPKVFLLDEPTTGLDPSTRSSIWNLVTSLATPDRAMIITTHMMIEADTLCNRIAIVSKGELKVVATQQHLKDNYGSGYLLQLNLVNSSPRHQEIAMAFVREHLHHDAVLQVKQAKTLRINLPRDLNLNQVFVALYNPEIRPDSINQFLLSQSSLEDVFIALGDN
jgi:ATP-binding cassette, subfamily A (ABC1), member 5